MTSTSNISSQLRQAFAESIALKIGIKIRQVEQESLVQKIGLRMKAVKLAAPEQYYQLLSLPGAASEREWQHLAELLTNNESYFFRDRQQLNLLKNQIFPQLINQKREQGNLTLRIWSAGCSTGQEPYSLAIMLKELLLDINAWNLTIFGTDIDLAALNQARAGIYSEWSFRDTEPRIKQQYFEFKERNYQIERSIRQMVTFKKLNLLSDQFPQLFSHLREIDLIVCRNVFIYFGSTTIGKILTKFYDTLQPNGYLLVGHSELTGQNLSRFQAQIFPQSLIYRRRESNSLTSQNNDLPLTTKQQPVFQANKPPVNPRRVLRDSPLRGFPPLKELSRLSGKLPTEKPPFQPLVTLQQQVKPQLIPQLLKIDVASASQTMSAKEDAQKLLQQAKHLWQQKQSNLAIKKAEQALAIQPDNISACCLLGKIYLELNQLDLAIAMSDRALAIDSLNLAVNYLLAEIALYQDDDAAAKTIFKKILYLDPESIKAAMELNRIYQQAGDRPRANKMAQQAMEILQRLPHSQILPTCNNLSVAELIFQLKTNA
jgi:chemotaxis protein methyltransferase CheR